MHSIPDDALFFNANVKGCHYTNKKSAQWV